MGAGSWPGLAGAAVTPDPWVERDRLTAGQPGEIHRLAGVFESAAREASAASESGARASLATGEAYRVDGTEVHAVDVHTNKTRDLLSGSGDDLERIGRILRGIGDELTTSTGDAVDRVQRLEGELGAAQNSFARYEQAYRSQRASAPPLIQLALDAEYVGQLATFRSRSLDLAQQAGRDVQNIVSTYDDMLGGRSKELSALGYMVPAGVNQGPGDVESDPDAGRRDAQTVADALRQPPGRQSMAEIDAASGQIRAINDKVARGEPLTAQERAYLNSFYEALGADNLAKLPDHLQRAAPTTVPGAPTMVSEQIADSALQPFGDSIMNLSDGARYESLPAPVRELIDTRLGHVDPNTGLRHLNPRFLDSSNYPPGSSANEYVLGGGVTGMDRYRAITDVMRSSTVKPGDELATRLADSAIQARQDLNAAHHMARSGMFRSDSGNEQIAGALDIMADDSAASDRLGIAARNNDASSQILLDRDDRAAILGLNWEDDAGANALVQAGTERDPAAGGGGTRQAEAALAVVREVGSDRDGYLGRMGDPMKQTVNDVGMQYIEAFAEPPVEGNSGLVDNRTDALGRDVGPSFQLTRDDRDHFLQFVAGTGDDKAADFQAQARIYGQTTIADALVNGTPEQVTRAMQTAGRLDGAISQANFDWKADDVGGRDAAAAAAAHAQSIEARANQGMLNTLAVGGKEAIGLAIGALPGGALVKTFGGPALSVVTEMVKGGIGIETVPPGPPTPALPQTLEDMRREDGTWATLQQNVTLAAAMDNAGLFPDGDRPAILTYDGNNDGVVDDPRSNSQNQSTLGPELTTALDRWGTAHAEPGTRGYVDPNAYLTGRSESFTATHDGTGTPHDSEWRDDRLYYGEKTPDGALMGRDPDPRRLDDPDWVLPR